MWFVMSCKQSCKIKYSEIGQKLISETCFPIEDHESVVWCPTSASFITKAALAQEFVQKNNSSSGSSSVVLVGDIVALALIPKLSSSMATISGRYATIFSILVLFPVLVDTLILSFKSVPYEISSDKLSRK